MRPSHKILTALALVGIGAHAVRKPQQASTHFGLPVTESASLGFVRATGTRDIALGLFLLAYERDVKIPLVLLALLSLADATTVAYGREKATLRQIAPHLLGCLGLIGFTILAAKTHD